MNIDTYEKFKNNFGVYVSLTLMGAGVGLFIGYYIESRRQEATEEVIEEIPPNTTVVNNITIVGEDLQDDIIPGDPLDIDTEEIEEDLEDESYEAIVISEMHENVNYQGISADHLDPNQIVLEEEVMASRYQLRDMHNSDDKGECVQLFINPRTKQFSMDLGGGMTAPITRDEVFGPDDSEIIDIMVDSFRQDPDHMCGVTDVETDRHWVVVSLEGATNESGE